MIKSLMMQADKVQSSNKQVNDELVRHHHSLGRALQIYNGAEEKRLKVKVKMKMRENVGEKREIDKRYPGDFFRDE